MKTQQRTVDILPNLCNIIVIFLFSKRKNAWWNGLKKSCIMLPPSPLMYLDHCHPLSTYNKVPPIDLKNCIIMEPDCSCWSFNNNITNIHKLDVVATNDDFVHEWLSFIIKIMSHNDTQSNNHVASVTDIDNIWDSLLVISVWEV